LRLSTNSTKGSATLDRAIGNGNEEVVRLLLEHKAFVNFFDADGYYPIHLAAKTPHPRIVSLLLDYNADIHVLRKGYNTSALHIAAGCLSLYVLRTLIARGADVNVIGGWEQKTPLHGAAARPVTDDFAADIKFETIQSLILSGAEVNSVDKFGRTPLHYAVAVRPSADQDDASADSTVEIINLLLEHDADIHAEATAAAGSAIPLRKIHWTPLHEAALHGDPAVIRALVSKGSRIDALDGDSETPLNATVIRLNTRTRQDFFKGRRETISAGREKVALQAIQALLDCSADPTQSRGWPTGTKVTAWTAMDVAQILGAREQKRPSGKSNT